MSFRIDDEKQLKKYKLFGRRLKVSKKFELNTLPVYDNRYTKTKIRTYGHKIYTNVRDLNVPEDDVKCESFTIISIDSLLACKSKYYLQVYLGNCAYKIVKKQMTDYLDENLFEGKIL